MEVWNESKDPLEIETTGMQKEMLFVALEDFKTRLGAVMPRLIFRKDLVEYWTPVFTVKQANIKLADIQSYVNHNVKITKLSKGFLLEFA